ncbi:MAG: DnaJ domain-containing protein [Pseudomonadota bacterium]
MQNFYEILGVSRDASPQVITSAYRKLALKHHPDRRGDAKIMQALSEGYNVLLDPEKRKVFDAQHDEMQQNGDINSQAVVVDGYLDSRGESFSTSFKQQHEVFVQHYQREPLAQGSIAQEHFKTIPASAEIFLTAPIAGLNRIMQGDFTLETIKQLTAYALHAPDVQFTILLNFFQSSAYRRACWQAVCQEAKRTASGDREASIGLLLSRFQGAEKAAAEVESVRQQFIQEDSNSQMGRALNAKLRATRLLHRYETDISEYSREKPARETAYQVLNWIPALAGRVDVEVWANLFLRVGLLFQQSSLQATVENERMADESLALFMFRYAFSYAKKKTPYFELSIVIFILKGISTFTFLSPEAENIFKAYIHRAEVLIDVFPFYFSPEVILDLPNNHDEVLRWMQNYLNALLVKAQKAPATLFIAKEKVLYYCYEGLLNHWLSSVNDPEVTTQLRLNLMLALLEKNGRTFTHVTQLLSAPSVFVDRDQNGWMRRDRGLPVPNLPALGQFKSLDGIEFHHDTGEITFQLTPWHAEMPLYDKLFTLADLGELFSKNLSGAYFSLDPADADMKYHPFNQMRFGPPLLEGSSLIQTMFLTDYLLKFLTVSQEVQGKYPFAFRSVNTLLENLPQHLQAIVHEFHSAPQGKHKMNRFYIEASYANYASDTLEDAYLTSNTKIVVPEVTMVVKKHALKRDAHGNVVDTLNDEEGWSIYIDSPGVSVNEHSLAQEERAIVFLTQNVRVKVCFWDGREFSSKTALSRDEVMQWLTELNQQTCDFQGKIEKTNQNAQLIYSVTKQITHRFNRSHHFSPEYVFAQSLTKHYNEFSQYFPGFARLRAFSQIMIFINLIAHVYKINKEEIINLEKILNHPTAWSDARSAAAVEHRQNQQSYGQQYTAQKARNKIEIQNEFLKFHSETSESKCYESHSSHLKAEAVKVRTLNINSSEIKKILEDNYKEAEKDITRKHGYSAWAQNKSDIYKSFENQRSKWVEEINQTRKKNLTQFLTSSLPGQSSWAIGQYVRDMMDYGNVHELATIFAKKEYNEILTRISSSMASSYPCGISASEMQALIENRGNFDDFLERHTTWQFSKLSQQLENDYQRALSAIAHEQTQFHYKLASRKKLEKNLEALGVGVEHKTNEEASQEKKLWIPASIHQDDKDGHHRLVYGGVNLMPNIEKMNKEPGGALIHEVFYSSDKRVQKNTKEIIVAQKFLQENSPGKLAEIAQEQRVEEAREKIRAEERRQEALRQQEIQRQQEEARKLEEARQQEIQRKQEEARKLEDARQQQIQRQQEEVRQQQAAKERMYRLQQEADEHVRQQRIAEERLQAEERERVRQREERKITFIEQVDTHSTVDKQVINRTIAAGKRFAETNVQRARDAYKDIYVEGLGIVVEEDQLFHQYITDEQGNTRRHLAAIFYPADKQQDWPEITAADYLIRTARSLGKENSIKKLKDKGVQDSGGAQGGILSTQLAAEHYDHLRTVIVGANPYYAGNESYIRATLFREAVNGVLSTYKPHALSQSKESAEFVKKWKQLTAKTKTSRKLDCFVMAISELMQKKNSASQESRLRDRLLTLWHVGLYLMAGEQRYVDKLIDESAPFLSIPLYPVESRTTHPQSQDTIGSYLLRILVERNNIAKIPALLAKGIEPPVDVILPKGMQSVGEKARIETAKQQKSEKQQKEARRLEIQRQQEEARQQQAAKERMYRLQQEADERARQQRLTEEHLQAEERERIRQREERKIIFIAQVDIHSTVDKQVINRTIAAGKRFSEANVQRARDAYKDIYVEGLGIIVEEEQLFHQYIMDEQGNTRRHLSVIFYPADTQHDWPEITAADYLIHKTLFSGKENLARELKQKNINKHRRGQIDHIAHRLKDVQSNYLREAIQGHFTSSESTLSIQAKKGFYNEIWKTIKKYEQIKITRSSKESRNAINKIFKILKNGMDLGLDAVIVVISELMREKNTQANASRLRDLLLDLWHAGLYLISFIDKEGAFSRLLEAENNLLDIPLYPVEQRTEHPWSKDTVGSYLLRIAVERDKKDQISALLAKNIEPQADVILPKGFQSLKEKERIETAKQQKAEKQQQEAHRLEIVCQQEAQQKQADERLRQEEGQHKREIQRQKEIEEQEKNACLKQGVKQRKNERRLLQKQADERLRQEEGQHKREIQCQKEIEEQEKNACLQQGAKQRKNERYLQKQAEERLRQEEGQRKREIQRQKEIERQEISARLKQEEKQHKNARRLQLKKEGMQRQAEKRQRKAQSVQVEKQQPEEEYRQTEIQLQKEAEQRPKEVQEHDRQLRTSTKSQEKEARNQAYQREEQRVASQREVVKTNFLEQRHNHRDTISYTISTDSVNTKIIRKMKMLSQHAFNSKKRVDQIVREKNEEAYLDGLKIITQDAELFYQYSIDEKGNMQHHLRTIFYLANVTQHWSAITAADYLIRSVQRVGREDLLDQLQKAGIISGIPLQKDVLLARSGLPELDVPHALKTVLTEYHSRVSTWRSTESINAYKNLTAINENLGHIDLVKLVVEISQLMQIKDSLEKASRLLNTLLTCWHTAIYLIASDAASEMFTTLLNQHSDVLAVPLYPVTMRTTHPWSQDTVGSYLLRIAVETNNKAQITALLAKNIEPGHDVLLPKGFASSKQKMRLEEERQQLGEQQAYQRQNLVEQWQQAQQKEAQEHETIVENFKKNLLRKTQSSHEHAEKTRAADEIKRQRKQEEMRQQEIEQEQMQAEKLRQEEITREHAEKQLALTRKEKSVRKVQKAEERAARKKQETGRSWAEERYSATNELRPEQETVFLDKSNQRIKAKFLNWFSSQENSSSSQDAKEESYASLNSKSLKERNKTEGISDKVAHRKQERRRYNEMQQQCEQQQGKLAEVERVRQNKIPHKKAGIVIDESVGNEGDSDTSSVASVVTFFQRKKFVRTSRENAYQSYTPESLAARKQVELGCRLYRGGKFGQSAGPEGQYWSLEIPLDVPKFCEKYGIPPENQDFEFLESAVLKPGAGFITREAPGVAHNSGGGIEVVINSLDCTIEYFCMPWEKQDDSIKPRTI